MSTPVTPAPLLRQKALEEYFDVSDWTVNQWVRQGCPVMRLPNGHRRFDLDAVKAWMQARAEAVEQATSAKAAKARAARRSA